VPPDAGAPKITKNTTTTSVPAGPSTACLQRRRGVRDAHQHENEHAPEHEEHRRRYRAQYRPGENVGEQRAENRRDPEGSQAVTPRRRPSERHPDGRCEVSADDQCHDDQKRDGSACVAGWQRVHLDHREVLMESGPGCGERVAERRSDQGPCGRRDDELRPGCVDHERPINPPVVDRASSGRLGRIGRDLQGELPPHGERDGRRAHHAEGEPVRLRLVQRPTYESTNAAWTSSTTASATVRSGSPVSRGLGTIALSLP
jgi:hypothetical protein